MNRHHSLPYATTTHIVCAGMVAFIAAAIAMAETTVTVSDVVARQRYPWSGLVDVSCTVSGIDGETNGLKLAVSAVMSDTGRARNATHVQVERGGAWSDDREVTTNGDYRLLWDATADLGPVRYTNMVVRVSIDAHERVQLWEDGPYWATTNIGAEEPWESGYYFWWGDTVGYKWENNAWVASDGSSLNFSFYDNLVSMQTHNKSIATLQKEGWIVLEGDTYILTPEHDAAQVQWGEGWRMPTAQELYDLCYNKCDWTWTKQNGVNGYIVCGRGDFADASIFLPASGVGAWTFLNEAGSYGPYWSSVPSSSIHYNSWHLHFGSSEGDHHTSDSADRGCGLSIRPVLGFTE